MVILCFTKVIFSGNGESGKPSQGYGFGAVYF